MQPGLVNGGFSVDRKLKTAGEVALRLLFGTTVYVMIVVLAAPFPSAAGSFLTFPALNGLAFFYSPRSSVKLMAKSMLWMPVINGGLCSAFIVLFLAFSHAIVPTVLAWILLILLVVLWLSISTQSFVRNGISHQRRYCVIVLIVGCALAALASLGLTGFSIRQGASSSTPFMISLDAFSHIFWQSKLKIALFAGCLLVFLLLTPWLPSTARGILGGLPIVPFGGLVSVGADAGADRIHIFERMITGVWLGPAVAVWFIFGYSNYLTAREPSGTEIADEAVKLFALLATWGICVIAILGISYVLI